MATLAKELEATIRNCQTEIDMTYEHFNLMLSLRKEIVAEYEVIRSKYKFLNAQLEKDIDAMRLLKKGLVEMSATRTTDKSKNECVWSGPYPLKRINS